MQSAWGVTLLEPASGAGVMQFRNEPWLGPGPADHSALARVTVDEVPNA